MARGKNRNKKNTGNEQEVVETPIEEVVETTEEPIEDIGESNVTETEQNTEVSQEEDGEQGNSSNPEQEEDGEQGNDSNPGTETKEVIVETPPENDDESLDEEEVEMSVEDILKSDMNAKRKLKEIKKIASADVVNLIGYLEDYVKYMNPKKFVDPKTGANKNKGLYKVLKGIVETSDMQTFKTKFTVVKLAFEAYTKDALGEVYLHRFDNFWTGNKKDLLTYQLMVSSIHMILQEPTSKEKVIKNLLDNKEVNLNKIAVRNLRNI